MSLKDKAAKINFAALGAPTVSSASADPVAPALDVRRPKTAPGAMMAFAADQRSDLLKENEQLRAEAGRVGELQGKLDDALGDLKQWDGAKATRLVDPAAIRRSAFANRHELSFEGPDFEQLKAEIKDAGGNVQPIKIRTLAEPQGEVAFELVFGHRRHEACRQLGLPVLAMVDNLDDRALFVEMERENRGRKDLSAWEQGVMYRRALKDKLFPSNRKLAEAIGVDLGAVGKALALADLPDGVIEAFASPLDLQYRWAKPLADAVSQDPKGVLARAAELKTRRGQVVAKAVFETLVAGQGREGVERFNPPKPRSFKVHGAPAGTVEMLASKAVVVTLEPGLIAIDKLNALEKALQKLLAEWTG